MVLHRGANSTKAIHKTAKGKAVVAHHVPVMDPKRKSHTVVIWLPEDFSSKGYILTSRDNKATPYKIEDEEGVWHYAIATGRYQLHGQEGDGFVSVKRGNWTADKGLILGDEAIVQTNSSAKFIGVLKRQSTHDQHEVIDQAIVEYTRQRYCKKIRLVFGNPSPHRHRRMLFLCTLLVGQTFPQTNP